MNHEEAREILLPYRQGTSDAEDPQVAEALALAKSDAELGRWLEEHCARQVVMRDKFRNLAVPEGLKEQIISEHAAAGRAGFFKKNAKLVALAGSLLVLFAAFHIWHQTPGEEASLTEYQNQMTSVIAHGYGMDLTTSDVAGIRNFLKEKAAPADFTLTTPLQHVPVVGCSVETWQDKKASLVCFHAGDSPAPAGTSDLWLFVVDRKLVGNVPDSSAPQFSQVNKLAIATWTDGDKLYVLSRQGDAQGLKKFL